MAYIDLGLVARPPVLDGSNYGYWKIRMDAYICSIEESAWTSVVCGWKPPTDEKGATKERAEWNVTELNASNMNQKALNAIQGAVSMEVFAIISTCKTAKEAWDILECTYEGNTKVKRQRLQQITTQFELLRMEEDEEI